ncbi:hypothetical protein AGMMS50276_32410 [Synergistales bacterium]|nr:hypothetical protein AGMMS50276_32410 [Synergistales bacterium]
MFAAITGGYSWSESLSGGSVFYGGLIGFFVGLLIYAKYVKRPFLMYANFLTPYIALGHSFGRIGCLLGGCCYGAESGLFPFIPSVFSIKYPITHPTLAHPVLPIPLAESILCLLLSLFLFTRKSEKDNFMIYLTVYSVLRFALEFGRGDKIRGIYGLFSTSQWISIGVFFFVSAWFLLYKKPAVKI